MMCTASLQLEKREIQRLACSLTCNKSTPSVCANFDHKCPMKFHAYLFWRNPPRAGSYSPPGVGFKRVSKVVESYIRFTLRAFISWEERKAKSTPCMASETGAAMFMTASEGCSFPGRKAKDRQRKLGTCKGWRRKDLELLEKFWMILPPRSWP
jgi:hypothetical protein